MFLKGIYAGKPAIFQLTVLLLLILAGAVFSSLIVMGFFYMIYGLHADITQYSDMMRLLQLISALGTFLFPALALAWLCSYNPKEYLSIGKMPKGHILLLTFLSIFLITPSISLTGILNKQMELPSFMEPIENWMRLQEETAEQLTLKLLAGRGIITLFFNLIVIAVAAGITEEFLFRGALQRIIGKWTYNHHIIIWSAAIIFSTFHMQFFGFLPRMLLGAYFGYLLYRSKILGFWRCRCPTEWAGRADSGDLGLIYCDGFLSLSPSIYFLHENKKQGTRLPIRSLHFCGICYYYVNSKIYLIRQEVFL